MGISKKFIKNLHLLISAAIVVPTALIYGVSPHTLLPDHLDIQVNTVDLANFLRAIMMLYLGVAGVWIVGMVVPKYWKTATVLLILFMSTLGVGRLLSVILDGLPSDGYVFGLVAEGVLAIFGFYQFKKYRDLGV